jgi:hypothetical protein
LPKFLFEQFRRYANVFFLVPMLYPFFFANWNSAKKIRLAWHFCQLAIS